MLIAFSVAPTGAGEVGGVDDSGSVSAAVAEAIRVVRESGLPNRTDSMFTTIEGEWDECMAVVKRCCDVVGRYGSRVSLVLKADIRPGHTGELTGKLARLESALDAGVTGPASGRAMIRIGLSGWRYPHWRRGAFYPVGLVQRRELEFDRRRFRHPGTQRAVLLAAAAVLVRPLARSHAGRFRVRDQGQPVHHPSEEGGRRGRGAGRVLRLRPARPGSQAGPGALAATTPVGLPAGPDDRLLRPAAADRRGRAALAEQGVPRILDRFGEEPSLEVEDPSVPLRHAVEVRHDSFACDEFYDLCRRSGVALVVADTAGRYTWVDQVTTDLVYVRLHGDQEMYRQRLLRPGHRMVGRPGPRLGGHPRGSGRCRCISTTTATHTPRTMRSGWRSDWPIFAERPCPGALIFPSPNPSISGAFSTRRSASPRAPGPRREAGSRRAGPSS